MSPIPRPNRITRVPQGFRHSIDISSSLVVPAGESRKLKRRLSSVAKDMPKIDQTVQSRMVSSYKPKTLPLPELEYKVTFQFLENWGGKDFITCSEIDFLGKDRTPLPITSIVPLRKTEKPDDYWFLCDSHLIKSEPSKQWTHEWNSETIPVVVHFFVRSYKPPEYVRIWNNRLFPQNNVKRYAIYIDDMFTYCGEMPIDFGHIAMIKNSHIPILPPITLIEEEVEKKEDHDEYGKIPIPEVKDLTLYFLETYGGDSHYLGLNSIEIFDYKGNVLKESMIETIQISNGESLSSPYRVFKNKLRTMDMVDMWTARRTGTDNVSMNITLTEQQRVVMVRIWNYNGGIDAKYFGTKFLKLCTNNKCVWIGKIPCAKGMTSKILDGVFDIWLTDPKEFKNLPNIKNINTSRSDL